MRVFAIALAVTISSAVAFGQAGARGVPGYCAYSCGPYVPLISTPSISFETVSPSPVGASNATGGMHAGARNSTLEMITGNPDAVHTQVVWEFRRRKPAGLAGSAVAASGVADRRTRRAYGTHDADDAHGARRRGRSAPLDLLRGTRRDGEPGGSIRRGEEWEACGADVYQ